MRQDDRVQPATASLRPGAGGDVQGGQAYSGQHRQSRRQRAVLSCTRTWVTGGQGDIGGSSGAGYPCGEASHPEPGDDDPTVRAAGTANGHG